MAGQTYLSQFILLGSIDIAIIVAGYIPRTGNNIEILPVTSQGMDCKNELRSMSRNIKTSKLFLLIQLVCLAILSILNYCRFVISGML